MSTLTDMKELLDLGTEMGLTDEALKRLCMMNKIECVMNLKKKEVRDWLIKNVNFSYSLKRNAVIEHVRNTNIFLSLKRKKEQYAISEHKRRMD